VVRQQDLIVTRDRANLDQGLHAMLHDLAITLRELDSAYDQYETNKEWRAAATINLQLQTEEFRFGRVIFLNALQALTDWGNAVRAEAQTLIGYNINLATLERKTGTILETHGLVFNEERFRAAGPLGVCGPDVFYPASVKPGGVPSRYPGDPKNEPGENSFNLRNPAERGPDKKEDAPAPDFLPMPRKLE
jgi:hypothetical protein